MLSSPCHIISDIHLGYASPEVERALIGYLRSLPGQASSLLINGDLFEFWFEWKTVVPRSGVRVLAALMDLRDGGLPVTMIAGNHDCWGGDVLRDAGVDFRFGPWTGSLGGWNAYVDHGDGLRDEADRGYRMIRPVLRNRAAIWAYSKLHPDLASRLALGSSQASRDYTPKDRGSGLRQVAAQMLSTANVELLVYGHSHVPALERLEGGVYANAGSWLTRPTYLVADDEKIVMREWTGSPESPDLHVVERIAKKTLS